MTRQVLGRPPSEDDSAKSTFAATFAALSAVSGQLHSSSAARALRLDGQPSSLTGLANDLVEDSDFENGAYDAHNFGLQACLDRYSNLSKAAHCLRLAAAPGAGEMAGKAGGAGGEGGGVGAEGAEGAGGVAGAGVGVSYGMLLPLEVASLFRSVH